MKVLTVVSGEGMLEVGETFTIYTPVGPIRLEVAEDWVRLEVNEEETAWENERGRRITTKSEIFAGRK